MRQDIQESLDRYVKHGIRTGGFLYAVLTNNLFQAMTKADMENRMNLHEICSYIWNEIPSSCWGTEQKVEVWIARRGLEGKLDK